MSSETSRRRQTALALVEAYNSHDMDKIMGLRTEDCVQQILPRSLGRSQMDNASYAAWLGPLLPHLRGFTVTIDDVTEDAQANKVVLLGHSTASSDIGPYANEYVIVLYMNEAGDKVTKFFEFVDSNNSVTFFPKLREHLEQKARGNEK
ncbi:hypothetical protein O1611_g6740 [Lasiodiplodia mahajangana]|uniref:Uncharacterized protein n=1 Tax=Lasiodiplodia mahajangana TaxID=1108764 RepID=A0ACC2JHG8_9PEZI|nr:hypothetical protein O1611_g6740 [Lasiodiplodia mahajangana]